MDCGNIKKIIPDFLEGALGREGTEDVRAHLSKCPECQRAVAAYEKTWDMLGLCEEVEPDPGYVSRFWSRVSQKTPWYKRIIEAIRPKFSQMLDKRLIPITATVCIVGIVGLFTLKTTVHTQRTETLLTNLSVEEIEFIENIELVENLELIQDIEFYEDLEVIENWDSFEA